jgi:hypothetical protein
MVAADQTTLRVSYHVEVRQAMVAQQPLRPHRHGARHLLDRTRVEAPEEATEVHAIGAVAGPREPCGERAERVRRGEKAMQQEHRLLTAMKRRVWGDEGHRCGALQHVWVLVVAMPVPCARPFGVSADP